MDEKVRKTCLIPDNETAQLALDYMVILQEGRVKPDKHQNHAFVRDSIDNVKSINRMNEILTEFFKTKLIDNGTT